MTHVTKLFSLEPLEMGVMVTGIASIGDRTIKSLINEFKIKENLLKKGRKKTNYTVKSFSTRLHKFIDGYYKKEYKYKPALEFMVCGYDKQEPLPSVYRIYFNRDKDNIEVCFQNNFGIAFGGQMQEIQRLVFGTDGINNIKLIIRLEEILNNYRDKIQNYLNNKGITETVPNHSDYGKELHLFNNWTLNQFDANWGDFSEQNAIECVNFFVEVMIKSQQFSSQMPTVGGDVHIALITKEGGFRYISREEYIHEGYRTPMRRTDKEI